MTSKEHGDEALRLLGNLNYIEKQEGATPRLRLLAMEAQAHATLAVAAVGQEQIASAEAHWAAEPTRAQMGVARINAAVTAAALRGEGMKALNTHRMQCGNSVAYVDEAFEAIAAELDAKVEAILRTGEPGAGREEGC